MQPNRWKPMLCALAMLVATSGRGQAPSGASRVEELKRTAGDRKIAPFKRGEALAALERIDFDSAAMIAQEAITDPDEQVRFRAAWILADAGQENGNRVLREMAANRSSDLTLPILALGRLRDPQGHGQLRHSLEEELIDRGKAKSGAGASRATSLIAALGDYQDPEDAQLLADAVQAFYSSIDSVIVDALGRTGGREAIPELQSIFAQTTHGSTHLTAALGLFRCGSALGRDFVLTALRWQSETVGKSAPSGKSNDLEDAKDFVLRHLGARTDEAITPELIAMLRSARTTNRERAEVWDALLRIGTKAFAKDILELARKDLKYRAAARVLAVHDPTGVRSLLAREGSSEPNYERAVLQEALSATDRERRRWRELHGYAF